MGGRMRTVKTRDAATSILRKLGVTSREYNLYIQKTDAGFVVQETLARKSVVKEVVVDLLTTKDVELKPAAPEAKPAVKPAAPPTKQPRLSISGTAEQLLLAGKSNAETWAELKAKFKLGDDKKHYPSWFRSRLRRQGRLAKKEKKS
jgi:hypothetical protein